MKRNIYIDQGASFSKTLTVANTVVSNISGYAVESSLKKSYSSNTVSIFSASSNAETNEVSISLTANQTSVLDPGRYYYDILINDSNNYIRVFEGIATITPGVT